MLNSILQEVKRSVQIYPPLLATLIRALLRIDSQARSKLTLKEKVNGLANRITHRTRLKPNLDVIQVSYAEK